MYKIAVLVSGNGSHLQNIINNIKKGNLSNCKISTVISDRESAFAIERAKEHKIPFVIFDKKIYKTNISDMIYNHLKSNTDLIILAGFLSILKGDILKFFEKKIINIHPSLIPSFCGKGMYGLKVHEAVINRGVKVTGCTTHYVDEGTDTGQIIMQKCYKIKENTEPKQLQKELLKLEYKVMIQTINKIFIERST